MPEALNAVIYARYSSDRQTEQSIEGPPLQSNPNIFVTLDVFGLVVQIER